MEIMSIQYNSLLLYTIVNSTIQMLLYKQQVTVSKNSSQNFHKFDQWKVATMIWLISLYQ